MKFRANLLLLLITFIWGSAFVAQRVGMEYIGPYTYNALRFALGSFCLLPLILFHENKSGNTTIEKNSVRENLYAGIIVGSVLFIAASLQQIGLIYTTAGKAGFITCLYIVLVPIAGIFLKHKIEAYTWMGCLLAIVGLYFLSVKENFDIAYGDFLVLLGAFFWTAQILLIDYFSKKIYTLKLAFFQFVTCAVISAVVALVRETVRINAIMLAGIPIIYGGVFSVGIAFTLQIVAQKNTAAAHAAIIFSMETVFAALAGYLLLDESFTTQDIVGCALMIIGMLLSQLNIIKPQEKQAC